MKALKVSIVIPVYNEAARLGACLEAIARQTVTPLEVIVVDNNSTDETVAVVRRFGFVKLLREPKQGVTHARTTGFDAARGDVIARIDADSLLPPSWLGQVQAIFENPDISAVSGAPHYYDFPLAGVADAIDLPLRAYLARRLKDSNFLWGANMAVRRAAWRQIRASLCAENGIHEDFDLAIHLQGGGLTVAYDETLVAGVSSRRIDSKFIDYIRYSLVSPHTYARHGLRRRYHMYPVLLTCWFFYVPARLVYRAYDPTARRYSLNQVLATTTPRVDPTTNIV
jgi:glycosyltransferase involved in cell wall biosynthesis